MDVLVATCTLQESVKMGLVFISTFTGIRYGQNGTI